MIRHGDRGKTIPRTLWLRTETSDRLDEIKKSLNCTYSLVIEIAIETLYSIMTEEKYNHGRQENERRRDRNENRPPG